MTRSIRTISPLPAVAAILLSAWLLAWPAHEDAVTCRRMLVAADSLRRAAEYDSAMALARGALVIAEQEFGTDDTAAARAWHILGDCSRRLEQFDSAGLYLSRSLNIREKKLGTGHLDVARSLNSLALLQEDLGDYEGAEALHKRALSIRESAGSDSDMAQSVLNLAKLCYVQGRFAEAEPLYLRALHLNEISIGRDSPPYALGLNNLAMLYEMQGRLSDAEQRLRQALEIRERILPPEHPSIAQSLVNLAILEEDLGRYGNAEPILRRALEMYEANDALDRSEAMGATINLASLCARQGRYSDAERLLNHALERDRKAYGERHSGLAEILNNLAVVHRSQGHYYDAEKSYLQTIEIQEKAEEADPALLATALNNLAGLYWSESRLDEAEPLHRRALAMWEKSFGPEHPEVAGVLDDLGHVMEDKDRLEEAEALFRRALAIRSKAFGDGHPDVASSLSNLAQNLSEQGKFAAATELENGAWAIRRQNFQDGIGVLAERSALEYSAFLERESALYLSLLLDAPDGWVNNREDIAQLVFAAKGQVFDGMLQRNRALIADPDTVTARLTEELRYTRYALSRAYVEGPQDLPAEEYRDELSALVDEKDRLERELAQRSSRFAAERRMQDIHTYDIASSLPPGSVLVEFMRYDYRLTARETEPHYVAVVLRADLPPNIFELGKADEIDTAVAWYRAQLTAKSALEHDVYRKMTDRLYGLAWRPLAAMTRGATTVFIAPDGALNLVSFAGLIDDDGHYLIEDYPIHYLPTGRDLVRLKSEASARGTGLLAMGDPDYDATPEERIAAGEPQEDPAETPPSGLSRAGDSGCTALNDLIVSRLPGTRDEVEAVAQHWRSDHGEDVVVHLGSQASEERLKTECRNRRVIHLATHGFFLTDKCRPNVGRDFEQLAGDNPLLLSGLLLAGSNLHGKGAEKAEDGIVTAEEISGLDLNGTDMVVLSACETGLGEVKSGEGVFGLGRAFQMAGARTVISTLWRVDDKATAEFMGGLFAARNETIPAALQRIAINQITALRAGAHTDHPIFWAGFIASGAWVMQ